MENFNKQYIDSDIEQKRLLIGSIFPEKFQFDNKKVRTADINPILLKIASINKGLKGNKKRDKSKKMICPSQYTTLTYSRTNRSNF